MNKAKGIWNMGDEGHAAGLSRIIRINFIEKVTFVQRFKGGEGVRQADIWRV